MERDVSTPFQRKQYEQPLPLQSRISPDFKPRGNRSLSRISEYAFGLGISLGISTLATIQMAYAQHYLWRVSFFITLLSLFHYLEFNVTARYNFTRAEVSSFLLFNGVAYNIAHTTAVFEAVSRYLLKKTGYLYITSLPSVPFITVPIGIAMVVFGQTFRSLAMKQAGSSFNHVVQSTKKEDHVLVTTGVYSISRHPSYFGFFWWGLGTQLILRNPVCFVAYTVVLWRYFSHRIKVEEKYLVEFFGDDYREYRTKRGVLIPFIS